MDGNFHQDGKAQKNPILLLGSGITVLGVLRALALEGMTASCCDEEAGVERWSRWYRRAAIGKSSIAAIMDWCHQSSLKPIIIPCSDSWVAQVSQNREQLEEYALIGAAPAATSKDFLDKQHFAQLIGMTGVPAPRGFEVEGTIPSNIHFDENRWFLKPRMSQQFFARYGVKAWWPKNNEDAEQLLTQAFDEGHPMLIQEYIRGSASAHAYVEGYRRSDGVYDGLFARRRTRMYPPDFGNSTAMVSVPLEEVEGAVESIRKLLDSTNYAGVFSAEFKRDEIDKLWKVIEVNIRPWWYVEFAARCGVNVIAALIRDVTGHPSLQSAHYRQGVRMMNLYTDWAQLMDEKEITVMKGMSRIFEWLRTPCTVFSWSDPLPGFLWSVHTVARAIHRRVS